MNNVFPIRPSTPIPIRTEPVVRTQTVRELFEEGTIPTVGDFVHQVRLHVDEDNGHVYVNTPGSGRVRTATFDRDCQSLTLGFDFAHIIAMSGTTTITWYPDPGKETA